MNNLRKFATEADYSAATLNYPAVSWIVDGNTVHFDKSSMLGDIKATYTVEANVDTALYNGYGGGSGSGSGSGSGGEMFSKMWIDGVEQSTIVNRYTFATAGEHTVEFKLLEGDNIIGYEAFYGCDNLTSMIIGGDIIGIGEMAVQNCTGLTSIDILDSVTSIGIAAFEDCTSLTSVTIPNSVTSIGDNAFYNCPSLSSVTLGSGITSIGMGAFYRCEGLTSITIPNSVTEIGEGAFYDCTSLTSVTITATTPPTLGNGVFDGTNDCPIYVPSESVSAYQTAWSTYASRIFAIQ